MHLLPGGQKANIVNRRKSKIKSPSQTQIPELLVSESNDRYVKKTEQKGVGIDIKRKHGPLAGSGKMHSLGRMK